LQDFGGSSPEGRRLAFDVQKERLVQGLLQVLLATHGDTTTTGTDPGKGAESREAGLEVGHDYEQHVVVLGGFVCSHMSELCFAR
jgi:hypothetical protein